MRTLGRKVTNPNLTTDEHPIATLRFIEQYRNLVKKDYPYRFAEFENAFLNIRTGFVVKAALNMPPISLALQQYEVLDRLNYESEALYDEWYKQVQPTMETLRSAPDFGDMNHAILQIFEEAPPLFHVLSEEEIQEYESDTMAEWFVENMTQYFEVLEHFSNVNGYFASRKRSARRSPQENELEQKLLKYGDAMYGTLNIWFEHKEDALHVVAGALVPPHTWDPWSAIDASQ
jgi:hypothetical protein